MEQRMIFSEAIKTLRTFAGLTQRQLADASGLTVQQITSFETGARKDPCLSTLLALAKGLGCEVGIWEKDRVTAWATAIEQDRS
jgi:transcriptional regulator with XRE-family HTH domain